MDCKGSMIWKYDVFMSFRGEDTRNNFTGHLFHALHEKGFVTFKDDIKLTKGKDISTELPQAIEESQILIVVFSKDYASSKWCLQELAKIVDCIERGSGQTILPIFYDVNPHDVRRQSGNYEEAFVKHEKRFVDNLEMVQTWRDALTQVASLSGWDIQDKPQYKEIGKIVKEVERILSHNFSTISDDIVGMHSPLKELEKLLVLDSNDDVRAVGICGMGGIGKSTHAANLFCRISNQFEASCFIDDISRLFRDNNGPIEAQKQLLCQALNEEKLQLYNSVMATNLMRTRLRHKKVLVILDNVDEAKQLEKLAIKREWLGAGSRIIIISRDEHILTEYQVDKVFKVQLLSYRDALQLFCRKAFKCDDIVANYIDLTNEALSYANDHPLAIKVLSSFLFGRDVSEWRSALTRLRENPEKDIMDVLRISFDALKDTEKEIYLDISCFVFWNSHSCMHHLNIRGFHPEIGIKVLLEKSLLTKDEYGNIRMHDLLKELGKIIVREKSPKKPRKWSRLWDINDLHNVLEENMEAKKLEAIVIIQQIEASLPKTMRIDTFSKMIRLNFLKLAHDELNFSGSLNCLSRELRYIEWKNYPFQYLPQRFEPVNLVELILHDNSIKQLWKDSKPLPHLRKIDLSHSKNLITLPDFRDIPNLEWLNLQGCIKLVEIGPSIGILTMLVYLNLSNCTNLVGIPNNMFGLSSLEKLYLSSCSNLISIPNNISGLSSLKYLNISDCSNLVSIPNNIFCLSTLEYLYLSGCLKLYKNRLFVKPRHAEQVEMLENSIQQQSISTILKIVKSPFQCFYSRRCEESIGFLLFPSSPCFLCLKELDLSFCNLIQIPDAIGLLHSLERLNLGGNNFVKLPSTIKELSNLLVLKLEHCQQLKYLPKLPVRSKAPSAYYEAELNVFNCPNLIEIEQCYNISFSWMIQLLQGLMMESSLFNGRIDIIIPATEIPRWFNKQNAGSSINMDLTIHDENCLGVVCCARVLVAHDDDPTNSQDDWSAFLSVNFNIQRYHYIVDLEIRKDLITVESNHLFLSFFTLEGSVTRGTIDMNSTVELEIFTYGPKGVCLEVKSCGYHLVFKEDLKMMHSGNAPVGNRKLLANG